ncbi:hypothetical protein [Glycomyces paridis]|uniref:Uncharacterized protein n=1 Tax=Glycomyces paridis TaxID=2126555 RepID=A0A4S8PBI7_9ACTN|nr:hypothetical protein [Glycomyces paridis]THV27650.1 hypothetical protein E9998_14745 [Glycomyces paridis]
MKPVRLFKRLGAIAATGLIALGIIAGTASAAAAGGVSGEINSASAPSEPVVYSTSVSGEIN